MEKAENIEGRMSGVCSYRIIDNPTYQELFLYGEDKETDRFVRDVMEQAFKR